MDKLQEYLEGEWVSYVPLNKVIDFVNEAKPKWEQVIGQSIVGFDPVFIAVVKVDKVVLDLIAATSTGRHNNKIRDFWQIVVVDDKSSTVLANYWSFKAGPIKDLFDFIEALVESAKVETGETPAERAYHAIMNFLSE